MPNPSEVLRKLRSPGAVFLLGLVLFVLGAKFLLIEKYGSDLPFWDQWDAEADHLYIPAAEGRLHAAEFFAPHNEHRIAFTKAVAFALLKLNGQWDARVQIVVNAFIHVTAIALLLLAIGREVRTAMFVAAVLFCLVLFGLPLSWENTLAGFQSQFYFLLLFSVLHLAGTFLNPPGSGASWRAQIAGLCGLFSMGSGFFSAAVITAIFGIRACIRRSITRAELLLLGCNLILTAIGVSLMTSLPAHEVLKSHSIRVFIESFALLTAWPSPYPAACALTLFPIGWAVFARRTRPDSSSLPFGFLFALAAWWLLQVLALAYARGGDGHGMSPRYFDTLAIGALVGLLFWLRVLLELPRSRVQRTLLVGLAAVWVGATAHGLWFQTKDARGRLLPPLLEVNQSRIHTVADFVATKNPHFYNARPWVDIPYPNAERLGRILLDRDIQAILPSSVRPSLRVLPDISGNTGFNRNDHLLEPESPSGRSGWNSFGRPNDTAALFRSAPIARPHSHFLRLSVTGQLSVGEGTLYLQTPSQRFEIEVPADVSKGWKSLLIESPDAPFRVIAESQPGHAFAFSEPVEVPFGSWFAREILKTGNALSLGGMFFVLVALILVTREQVIRRRHHFAAAG